MAFTKNRYGCYDGDCIDNSGLLNRILGRCIGWVNFRELEQAWKAFYDDAEAYEGTVVIDMINLWANDKLAQLKAYSGPVSYGAQSVMLDDIQ